MEETVNFHNSLSQMQCVFSLLSAANCSQIYHKLHRCVRQNASVESLRPLTLLFFRNTRLQFPITSLI